MRFRGPVGPKGQRRNYSAITTRNYLRVVAEFAKYLGKSPDKLGPNELRTYQAYLLQVLEKNGLTTRPLTFKPA
jgi:integrase/recombinase XerD